MLRGAGQEAAAGLCSGTSSSCCRNALSPTPAAVGCGRVPVPSKWSLCCADALVVTGAAREVV